MHLNIKYEYSIVYIRTLIKSSWEVLRLSMAYVIGMLILKLTPYKLFIPVLQKQKEFENHFYSTLNNLKGILQIPSTS